MDAYNIPFYPSTSKSKEALLETWARGVEWELTRMVWKDYNPPVSNRSNYTGLVIDLIDPIDPDPNNFDKVTGYTIREIEDALIGQKRWVDWKNNIKNKYNNVTKSYLDILFDYWN